MLDRFLQILASQASTGEDLMECLVVVVWYILVVLPPVVTYWQSLLSLLQTDVSESVVTVPFLGR